MTERTVDAGEAMRKLGIKHPVSFKAAELNPRPLELSVIFRGGLVGAQTIPPGDVVAVDWEALDWSGDDPADAIAHELIHVRQMQDLPGYPDVEAINRAYRAKGGSGVGFRGNAFEEQAYANSSRFEPYVQVGR